jgi:hypothetical protein
MFIFGWGRLDDDTTCIMLPLRRDTVTVAEDRRPAFF